MIVPGAPLMKSTPSCRDGAIELAQCAEGDQYGVQYVLSVPVFHEACEEGNTDPDIVDSENPETKR